MILIKISCGSKLLFYLPNCSCFCKGQMPEWLHWKKQLDKKAIGRKFISHLLLLLLHFTFTSHPFIYMFSSSLLANKLHAPIPSGFVAQPFQIFIISTS